MYPEQLKYYGVREFLDSEIERLTALIKEYKDDEKANELCRI